MRQLLYILSVISILYSCKPDDEVLTTSSEVSLRFSEDTVCFDTILTSVGSITKRFKVYNDDKNAINISNINVAGINSPYSIIVNGVQQNNHSDILILGEDSMQVLVEVTIDPSNQDLPYLVRDSVEFITNGNFQHVKLMAYGQDANFLSDSVLSCGETWSYGKPYVIIDSVTVPVGCNLTINKGTRILFNYKAKLIVEGTLSVVGTKDSLVTFCNENEISNMPEKAFGYWTGIIFKGTSTGNSITHARIKNAETGLYLTNGNTVDSIPELTISNTIIKDMSKSGIQVYGADVFMENIVITNCTDHLFAGLGGGNYSFLHSSLANYSFDFFRNGSALELNSTDTENGISVSNPLELHMVNTVVDGNLSEELEIDGSSSTYAINSMFKTNNSVFNGNGNQIDVDPEFVNSSLQELQPDTLSPLINAGSVSFGNAQDLTGTSRDANPDIGAFEYVP